MIIHNPVTGKWDPHTVASLAESLMHTQLVLARLRARYGDHMCTCDLHRVGRAVKEIPESTEDELFQMLHGIGGHNWWNGAPIDCPECTTAEEAR